MDEDTERVNGTKKYLHGRASTNPHDCVAVSPAVNSCLQRIRGIETPKLNLIGAVAYQLVGAMIKARRKLAHWDG
jgi:hypothetical protein